MQERDVKKINKKKPPGKRASHTNDPALYVTKQTVPVVLIMSEHLYSSFIDYIRPSSIPTFSLSPFLFACLSVILAGGHNGNRVKMLDRTCPDLRHSQTDWKI